VRNVACIGELRSEYNLYICKPEGKRPLCRPRHRWDEKIKMEVYEIVWKGGE
jgi:hypothetical protein